MQLYKQAKVYDTINGFSRWKEFFNYFGDANAPQRIAGFIDEYMDIVMASSDTQGALKLAVKHYTSKKIEFQMIFPIFQIGGNTRMPI